MAAPGSRVLAIHALLVAFQKEVDARDKRGHDDDGETGAN